MIREFYENTVKKVLPLDTIVLDFAVGINMARFFSSFSRICGSQIHEKEEKNVLTVGHGKETCVSD